MSSTHCGQLRRWMVDTDEVCVFLVVSDPYEDCEHTYVDVIDNGDLYSFLLNDVEGLSESLGENYAGRDPAYVSMCNCDTISVTIGEQQEGSYGTK